MKQNELPKTLQQAILFFSDDLFCVQFLANQRWADGQAICPKCGSTENSFMEPRRLWQCKVKECRKQFSIKVNTIFEDSAIGLDKWLIAMWLIATCKNGISSYELHRALGITQKSAWFVLHRIRTAMTTGTIEKLSGEVECDETAIGANPRKMNASARKSKNIRQGSTAHKTTVMGMVQRSGKVKAQIITDRTAETVREVVLENVEHGSELMTDEFRSYRNLKDLYTHQFVNHAVTYVRDNVHTNNIENFWSLLKRTIKGTYVSVSPAHLQKYVEEQMFRYNERHGNDQQRFVSMIELISGKRLTYSQLIGYETRGY